MRDIATAQQKAVSAKVAYWDFMRHDRAPHVHGSIMGKRGFHARKARAREIEFNEMMDGLARIQRKILDWLAKTDLQGIGQGNVLKLLSDISNTVSLTNSFLDEAEFGLCDQCLIECATRLNEISDLNGHLDSYAESLRVALDDTCNALLANLAREVSTSSTHID
jgi:hypothetical protein